jgi:predicted PurR-regulated permease PerM
MIANDHPPPRPDHPSEGWTREHVHALGFVLATVLLVYLCYLLARPLLTALAWALALAVIAHPLHARLAARLRAPNLAAALALVVVALTVLLPAGFVADRLVREGTGNFDRIQAEAQAGQWDDLPDRHPQLAALFQWLDEQVNLRAEWERLVAYLLAGVPSLLLGSLWAVFETLAVFYVLFYFFRDRQAFLVKVRSLLPLTPAETDEVFGRVTDMVHATVYGTLLCAAVQGTLGGLIFWWLGLPTPTLWGLIMGLLAVVPYLGAFVVWVPVSVYFALVGAWDKAAILAAWGGIVIALIDNFIYPILVGKEMRLHSLPVFIAIVGGFILFGAAGVILGPVILAVTDAFLTIGRRRLAAAGTEMPGLRERQGTSSRHSIP